MSARLGFLPSFSVPKIAIFEVFVFGHLTGEIRFNFHSECRGSALIASQVKSHDYGSQETERRSAKAPNGRKVTIVACLEVSSRPDADSGRTSVEGVDFEFRSSSSRSFIFARILVPGLHVLLLVALGF
jgi:hypothetical protein